MENERRPTIKIDPKGDVILDLTSQEGKTGLLVSSKVLSLVSSVFDTMLNSSFKESLHNQPADKIPIVPLPEDDAEAFTILCKVLHYRMDDFPRVLTPNCLVNIAIIADKYNFVAAITLPSTLWLHSAIANYTFAANCRFANLKKIMLAAYVLDIPDAFSETSWKLLFKHIGPHFDMPGITDHELVAHPANIIAELNARAACVTIEIQKAFESVLDKPLSSTCKDFHSNVREYLLDLKSYGIWPLSRAIEETGLADTIATLLTADQEMRYCSNAKCAFCRSRNFSFTEELRALTNKIVTPKLGICLDCVKTGRVSLLKKRCRIEHS